MNRPPEIFVDTGYVTDQNGALTEIVTPNVVATLNAPTKITFLGQTLSYVPSTAAALQEFEAPNMTTLAAKNLFTNYASLTTISMSELRSLTDTTTTNSEGMWKLCSALRTINMPKLQSIEQKEGGMWWGCTSIIALNFPELTTITVGRGNTYSYAYPFHSCTGITTITMPKLSNTATQVASGGVFYLCTGLTSVQLGSDGHPVASLSDRTFNGCTQSGLTITIYTQGGAALSGEPWGATNADIEYEEA